MVFCVFSPSQVAEQARKQAASEKAMAKAKATVYTTTPCRLVGGWHWLLFSFVC